MSRGEEIIQLAVQSLGQMQPDIPIDLALATLIPLWQDYVRQIMPGNLREQFERIECVRKKIEFCDQGDPQFRLTAFWRISLQRYIQTFN
ncbi:hypothetical protein KKC32_02945 [Patescibacteria group bacterium]|nr:hypothetical protein [Patescibacteria group bacterium]